MTGGTVRGTSGIEDTVFEDGSNEDRLSIGLEDGWRIDGTWIEDRRRKTLVLGCV
jgi:hypothetical protein